MKKQLYVLTIVIMTFLIISPAYSDITSTNVSASLSFYLNTNPQGVVSDSNPTYISISGSESTTGISGSALLKFDPLTSESTNLHFDFTMKGDASYTGTDIAALYENGYGNIYYHAPADTVLDYSWDFDYAGTNNWGMNYVTLYSTIFTPYSSAMIAQLGSIGDSNNYTGSGVFNLAAGNDYLIQINFQPNLSWIQGNVDGRLVGDIGLVFSSNSAAVPEPATMLLLGLGLMGLAGVRRFKN